MPRGFFLSTGRLALIEKLNLLVAYFWIRNTAAVTRTPITPIAAAKLWFWPVSPRYWL